ncbi:MAG: type II toxin-antitoxin system RelE/ParE family toxin [Fibromonadaceae bacterium]|jgi:plasmid stabilization system protein ParE|nr:type II toxin-antitoxin system RelE/ParE family toxin [Fibromonadaceae bacterium]
MEYERIAKPTKLTDRCEKQANKAVEYLEEKSPKQATVFKIQFLNMVDKIGRQPRLGTSYKKGMRKIQLGKFRYFIYYKEFDKFVSIRGIWHTSRGTDFSED